MPFVDRTNSKQQLPTDARKLFVGRSSELHFFLESILKSEKPSHNIVSIWGQGGVGKSTLVARFINEAHATNLKDYCLAALVDERQTTPVSIMEKLADQLQITGAFEKALERYREALRRLRSEQEVTQEELLQRTAGLLGDIARDIPVPLVNTLAGKGTEIAAEYFIEKIHYHQFLKDARRLEDPIADLTRAFVQELNTLADTQVAVGVERQKRRRRIILCFDTFERLAPETAPWLLDYFLEADISLHVVLVVAGRYPIERSLPDDPKRWLLYQTNNVIYSICLESFTEDETRKYLTERGIIDEARIATIWQLSRGLPLYLGLLTANPQGTVDPTTDVVANFLRWIPKTEEAKQKLVLDMALLSRPFNQDELKAFSYVTDQERAALYRWLTSQPFTHSNLQDGRYGYHELARDLFSRHLYQLSPDEYYDTRKVLVKYYQQLLEHVVQEQGRSAYKSAAWQELALALAYQLFLLPDETSHIRAIEQIVDVLDHIDRAKEEEVGKILRDITQTHPDNRLSQNARHIISRFLSSIGTDLDNQEALAAITYLLKKVELGAFPSPKSLAALYNARGLIYDEINQHQQALADYGKAIELAPAIADKAIYHYNRGETYYSLKDYEKALIDFNKAIELEPDDADFYVWRARAHLFLKNYEQALIDDTHAIKLDPAIAVFYGHRASVYFTLKRFEQALADYGKAIELEPGMARSYYLRATVYRALQDDAHTLTDLGKAIELEPDTAYLYYQRAQEYFRIKKYEQAISDYGRAIELRPETADYYNNLGLVYYGLKRYEQALDNFDKAIELNPDDHPYYYNRGNAYIALKNYERALADFEKAIELRPDIILYHIQRGNAYRDLQDHRAALTNYDKAIAQMPGSPSLYLNRGRIYYYLKNYQQALADFNKAIELKPETANFYNWRGNSHYALKVYQSALADYNQAIALDSNRTAFYHYNRGRTHYKLKDYKRALVDCTHAIAIRADVADYYNQRGDIYVSLQEYEHAVDDYCKAIELVPERGAFYSGRAYAYLHLQKNQQALADCNQAIKLNPEAASSYVDRGVLYLWLKDLEMARIDFVHSKELDINDAYTDFMIIWIDICQEPGSLNRVERLETNARLEGYAAHICQGILLWLRGQPNEALREINEGIETNPEAATGYFWKGMIDASLGQDAQAIAALERALEENLPPVLLLPLRWLGNDHKDFYQQYALPLLVKYDVYPI